jgi:hypothetical protein
MYDVLTSSFYINLMRLEMFAIFWKQGKDRDAIISIG